MFGETPNRATGTVALPFFDCIVPAKAMHIEWVRRAEGALASTAVIDFWPGEASMRQFKSSIKITDSREQHARSQQQQFPTEVPGANRNRCRTTGH